MTTTNEMPAPATKGRVLRAEARYYDVLVWLLTLGRERAFRERLADLARLRPGERVLDVGCGTGAFALAAKRRVGPTGTVHGLDASPEMIERARRQAARAGADVTLHVGVVEALPFPDAHFDAVASTLMLHHLPRAVRQQCAREMRRVLKPGGRVLAVDFATPTGERRGLLARLHRHGHAALDDIVNLLAESGLTVEESGAVGVRDLQFALATVPGAGGGARDDRPAPAPRSLGSLPAPRWVLPAVLGAVVLGHGIVLRAAWSGLAVSVVALAAVIGLVVLTHLGLVGRVLARRRPRR